VEGIPSGSALPEIYEEEEVKKDGSNVVVSEVSMKKVKRERSIARTLRESTWWKRSAPAEDVIL